VAENLAEEGVPPCTGGGSGGAGQVNCALTHHGLEDRVDLAVPWSGFWMERLDIWCLDDDPRNGELHYSGSACRAMDRSYGFLPDQGGPCVRRDESFRPAFTADSLSAGGDLSARLQTEVGY
jgi:hypothetical protein